MEINKVTVAQVENLIEELFDGKHRIKLDAQKIGDVYGEPESGSQAFLFTATDSDGVIIGMATLYHVRLLTRHLGVIEEVVTLKPVRGNGVGTTLVNQAIEMAKKLGCDCVELNVRKDKKEVKKFYEKLGFKDRKNDAMRLTLKAS
jgi:ribosomal protein S18 acetylase RimI-like enzyme